MGGDETPRVCAWCYLRGPGMNACGKCRHRFYCSREHQVLDWKNGHKRWCGKAGEIDFDYEVKESPGKGMGLFTLRDFKRGEKILVERPVVVASGPDLARWPV